MVEEIPGAGEREADSTKPSAHPVDPEELSQERALLLAAEIALLKSKIQNTEHILNGVREIHDKQKAQLETWREELASLKEGQLLLGVE